MCSKHETEYTTDPNKNSQYWRLVGRSSEEGRGVLVSGAVGHQAESLQKMAVVLFLVHLERRPCYYVRFCGLIFTDVYCTFVSGSREIAQ